jgi:hypothetical protein
MAEAGLNPVKTLEAELQQALITYRSEAHTGTAQSIEAVCRYLWSIGIKTELTHPLVRLALNIRDKKADARKPLGESVILATLAAAIDVLMPAESLEVAARKIAGASGGITANRLIEYRKNIRKRRGRSEAREMYWSNPFKLICDLPTAQREVKVLAAIDGLGLQLHDKG